MTSEQAVEAGLTRARVRTLLANGWTRPARGLLVAPEPADPFRTSLRVALLLCPLGIVCGMAAARLHQLAGLSLWQPSEVPCLLLPPGSTAGQRQGLHTHYSRQPVSSVARAGFRCVTLNATVAFLASALRPDYLICALDSALRTGWQLEPDAFTTRQLARVRAAMKWTDARSESTLETLLRLLLVRAGLAPEELQFKVFRPDGSFVRLDFAWPSLRLAIEADGREFHDKPDPLYRDRWKQNHVVARRWAVLRFTWDDVVRRPALGHRAGARGPDISRNCGE